MIFAAATSDGRSLCDNLARSTSFVVFEAVDGRIVRRSVRERFRNGCGNHAGFVDILAGCTAVICGGIGKGAADSLATHGVEPVVASRSHTLENAAALFLAGKLETTAERVCLC